MKNRRSENGPNENWKKMNGPESINQKTMKKNKMRMGGKGLSLEAFANAKTKSDHYNPALIKKQREFYKNAKYVSKYKKSQKHGSHQIDPSSAILKDGDESARAGDVNREREYNKKNSARSLKEVYEKKHEEQEKARIEREASIQAKKEEIERAQSRRKALREKILKRTRSGQPVMKYRIEQILERIQGSKL